MLEFIGTLIFRAGFNYSVMKALERMEQISNGFSFMDKSRFDVIFASLRGFDVVSRPPSKSVKLNPFSQTDRWDHHLGNPLVSKVLSLKSFLSLYGPPW